MSGVIFFTERIGVIWNSLPPSIVDFRSLSSFKRTINNANVNLFARYWRSNFCVVFSERERKRELTFTFAICHRPSVCLSVVCNVRAPYSGDWNFRQCFYIMWYLGHPWPLYNNFTEIVPGEPLRWGLNPRGVAKYSDFRPFEGYISETMQDMI